MKAFGTTALNRISAKQENRAMACPDRHTTCDVACKLLELPHDDVKKHTSTRYPARARRTACSDRLEAYALRWPKTHDSYR